MTVRLPYRPPLDWAGAVEFLRLRATRGVEVVEHDRYRRTVRLGDSPATIELRPVAGESHLLLVLDETASQRRREVVVRAQRIFDLGAEPLAIADHLGRSPELAEQVRRRPGIRVPGAWDPFELAVRAILGQQITVRGASTLAGRLVAALGEPYDGGDGLTHLFPTPQVLAGADLTGIGATGAQARTIRALATAIADQTLTIDASAGLEQFIERICRLPGVGPWTAHYVAMRACGEADAFPASDLGLRRAAGNGTPLSASDLSRRAEQWRPWRAYAAMYLWSRP